MKDKAIIFDWTGTLYERNIGLFPYAKEVLRKLQTRYVLGLVSKTGESSNREDEIEQTGVVPYFYSIIIAQEKTPEEFQRCMTQLNTTPNNTMVVGDRMKKEIAIGNQLGCETYWINMGRFANELPTKQTGQPTHIISSARDLLTLL